jgi:hypothetical protein
MAVFEFCATADKVGPFGVETPTTVSGRLRQAAGKSGGKFSVKRSREKVLLKRLGTGWVVFWSN